MHCNLALELLGAFNQMDRQGWKVLCGYSTACLSLFACMLCAKHKICSLHVHRMKSVLLILFFIFLSLCCLKHASALLCMKICC